MSLYNKRIFVFSLYCVSTSVVAADNSQPHEDYFDPAFLNVKNSNNIDISRFNTGSGYLPGVYDLDVYINGVLSSREKISFTEQQNKHVLPCLSVNNIKKINFNYENVPADFLGALSSEQSCINLSLLLPDSAVSYDSGLQQLNISIPNVFLKNTARGYVSPELWDSGISAFSLGYDANVYSARVNNKSTNSGYISLNSGLNLNSWYLRHNGNYTWQEQYKKYQSLSTYLQRDIEAIKGRVLIGQTNTRGQLFDTLSFKGVQLFNVEQMLPSSQRGYAPEIRGVARTNARVLVRQNGRLIYERTVPPGAFQISDLYPTGYGGDLDVTIVEANGETQSFQVPYSSLTELLRPGTHKYSLVAGKLDNPGISSNPALYEMTYQRGILNELSANTGIQASQNYLAGQVGTAVGTPVGSFSLSVTNAQTKFKKKTPGTVNGQSYQLSFSKYINSTNSNLTIATYRYSTSGFMDFLTAARSLQAEKNNESQDNVWRPKNRFVVALSQGLSEGFGQLYLSGYRQDYWRQDNSDLQYQFGYNNSYNSISYNLNAGRTRNYTGQMETNVTLSVSIPIYNSRWSHTPQLTASVMRNNNGMVGEQLGVSGSLGNDNQYSYGVAAANYNQGQGSSMDFNGQYRNPSANLSGSYSTGKGYQNASAGISGTVLAWQNGIVMTPYTSDTFAIVEARGAKGAKVSGYPGIEVDSWGHAAVPYLNPYEMNEITIDPKNTSYNVELDSTTRQVAPFEGAIVALKYETNSGYPLLITSKQSNNDPLPFGAAVFDSKGDNVGYVGQAGLIYVRVKPEKDRLTVTWGEGHGKSCNVNYQIESADAQKNKGYIRLHDNCVSPVGSSFGQ